MRAALTAAALSLLACGGGPDAPSDWETAAPLFEPDRLLMVDIQMLESDWDALRTQTRTPGQLFDRPNCLDSPFPSPFSWFRAEVTIDGEPIPDAAVRKKGFIGSLDEEKPSLKISTDEIDVEGAFYGLDKLTLNNSKQDPSYVGQCITYDLFARAGIAAPRCNFAHVTLNGRELGVYVHVEGIEDELVAHHFGDAEGNLYEGTISDFHPDWSGTFEKKLNEDDPERADLEAVIAAAQVPDDELIAALDAVIDLDEFFRFWALEVIVQHWDGYAGNTNNYWLYESGGRLHFMPWGVDQVLLDRNPVQGAGAPTSLYATGILSYRLLQLEEGRTRYEAALRTLLDEVWDEPSLLAEIDRMQLLLTPHISSPQGFENTLTHVRTFIEGRRDAILTDIEGGLPGWSYGLRDPFCD